MAARMHLPEGKITLKFDFINDRLSFFLWDQYPSNSYLIADLRVATGLPDTRNNPVIEGWSSSDSEDNREWGISIIHAA